MSSAFITERLTPLQFAQAARRAEAKGLVYGVELEHRPDNPHDANAIAVIGVAERSGWFRRRVDRWHIGYLDREIAAEIVGDLVSKRTPVAAELYSIYEGRDGFLDFKIIVLALSWPPAANICDMRYLYEGDLEKLSFFLSDLPLVLKRVAIELKPELERAR